MCHLARDAGFGVDSPPLQAIPLCKRVSNPDRSHPILLSGFIVIKSQKDKWPGGW